MDGEERGNRGNQVFDRVLERLAALPAVADAAFTSEHPLTPGGSTSAFTMRSPRADDGMTTAQASPRIVSPHYFSALGLRIVSGRGFTAADVDTTLPVAIVNRAFARRYLDDSPVGAGCLWPSAITAARSPSSASSWVRD